MKKNFQFHKRIFKQSLSCLLALAKTQLTIYTHRVIIDLYADIHVIYLCKLTRIDRDLIVYKNCTIFFVYLKSIIHQVEVEGETFSSASKARNPYGCLNP